MPDVFEGILGQPRVRRFLRAAVSQGRASHAYLFVGPAGSGKLAAATAFASALVCAKGGCGSCDDCRRVARGNHPDVRKFAPEGAHGYLVEQVRGIVSDVALAPIRAARKVYILEDASALSVQSANAFLKTLEEPPEGNVFILLAPTRESVLPTIASRCQVVPFRNVPASEAAGILSQRVGVTPERALIALEACSGSLEEALSFARSSERSEFRTRIMEVLGNLSIADEQDVLTYARELLERSKVPLDNVRTAQAEELADSADFLSQAALRQIEARHKRALSQASARSLRQLTAMVRSWLRDVLMVANSSQELVVNVDQLPSLQAAAQVATCASLMEAIHEADRTDEAIAYNVSPETCLDTLLFTIRKAVHGPRIAH